MDEVMEEYCGDEGRDSERVAEEEEIEEEKRRSEEWRRTRLQIVDV